jgi:hypothetical protein
MQAGTLSPEAAAFMLCAAAGGASILMGAVPGGAGKSTLLASALCMLPPGERIIPVSGEAVLSRALGRAPADPECYLAHEIGAGHYLGYIWGSSVRHFFELIETGRRIASCLHADSLAEAQAMVGGAPLLVSSQRFSLLGLAGFLRLDRTPSGLRRRLSCLYGHTPGLGLHLAIRWRESDDTYEMVADPAAFGIESRLFILATALMADLRDEGLRDLGAVRARIAEFYRTEGR